MIKLHFIGSYSAVKFYTHMSCLITFTSHLNQWQHGHQIVHVALFNPLTKVGKNIEKLDVFLIIFL